ncbi:GMP/IMP nucleotidase [Sulfurirhabdus autotrophica]|uniref:Putative hydrolase of the HAD superfamily n=1 Tax=Sulfurirhabdus autotrophica TaxID=1706046 RepID=A0A4R3YIA4_9PROT|nr:GMP/IMP nucleotidase [Sulfurirhabdus autotrophica]TCV90373.1 putative hydrolase of the HAD superfamily [Sulfurirhabdus autotrophica]
MIDWNKIETVFLDMDGTLLDLHFDNHFWLSHVPQRYAERHGVNYEDAHADLAIRYQRVTGTMQWYCVDYWTRELSLDIEKLKEEVAHLIAVRPDVLAFLSFLRSSGKRLTLVTNAHSKSLSLKMKRTELGGYFDAIICAHDLGMPKEQSGFWGKLQTIERFDPALTLLVDDSLPVLRSAREYGIAHLLAIHQPDSKQPAKKVEEFMAVERFNDIISI